MEQTASEHEVDTLWANLGALPAHDLGAERADRARRTAKAVLSRPASRGREGAFWSAFYRRALEPAWVVAVAAVQIALVVERLTQIYGG